MKHKVIKLFRIMSGVFIVFSFLALLFQVIYLAAEGSDEIVFALFIGPIVTFFHRFAMGGFFYLFSMFYEDWLKAE